MTDIAKSKPPSDAVQLRRLRSFCAHVGIDPGEICKTPASRLGHMAEEYLDGIRRQGREPTATEIALNTGTTVTLGGKPTTIRELPVAWAAWWRQAFIDAQRSMFTGADKQGPAATDDKVLEALGIGNQYIISQGVLIAKHLFGQQKASKGEGVGGELPESDDKWLELLPAQATDQEVALALEEVQRMTFPFETKEKPKTKTAPQRRKKSTRRKGNRSKR